MGQYVFEHGRAMPRPESHDGSFNANQLGPLENLNKVKEDDMLLPNEEQFTDGVEPVVAGVQGEPVVEDANDDEGEPTVAGVRGLLVRRVNTPDSASKKMVRGDSLETPFTT